MSSSSKFKLVIVLEKTPQFISRVLASLVFSCVILGSSSAIANEQPTQVTLSVDSTFASTFSDLINQAESLAQAEISQRFQADPTLNELQITVLGERNGQLVSLLSSKISRSAWQANPDIRQWTQYFSTSGALLGYRGSDQTPTQASERSRIVSSFDENDPSETLEQARSSRRISEQEYWQLVDALD